MKLGNILLLVFVPCFLIVISWISYADWRKRQHFLTVSLANNCHLMIEMEEINSFLDYPVEFNLALQNPQGIIEKAYEFSLGRGPYAIIRVSLEDPQILEIVGYYTNRNHVDRFELPRDLHLQLGDTLLKINGKFEAMSLTD